MFIVYLILDSRNEKIMLFILRFSGYVSKDEDFDADPLFEMPSRHVDLNFLKEEGLLDVKDKEFDETMERQSTLYKVNYKVSFYFILFFKHLHFLLNYSNI